MTRHHRWLLEQLPQWQSTELIDARTAERLRAHYADHAHAPMPWFALISVVLVGLGLILLVAHNWDALPLGARLGFALTPLLIGQIACVITWRAHRDAVLWREASSAWTALAFAAALALLSQIFHWSGELDQFLLICAAVTLPLALLFQALLTSVFYAVVLCFWAASQTPQADALPGVLIGFAALWPLLRAHRDRHADHRARSAWLWGSVLPLLGLAVWLTLMDSAALSLWWLASLGALTFTARADALPIVHRYGALAVTAAAVIGSLDLGWREGLAVRSGITWGVAVLGLLLCSAGLLWNMTRLQRGEGWRALWGIPALLLLLPNVLASAHWGGLMTLALSLWLLLAALTLMRLGTLRQHLPHITQGLLLLALLLTLRFLDSQWSLTARALAFIGMGALLGWAHLRLRNRIKA
ncbi:DUF2157 domain-containing protein [Sinimarinibacterium sp. NLF-5-8]|uniref:DUF2157 domain-containing protein n=1 Tax=Sinimarinibacterium sp. NLF-5-8 TaxID=2698684 RepID=UPI00137BD4A6|nr:DUF2157 domain-containing protein [Sinimarinibacterium sp. NLF-5-8]QHS09986.1 DUF2157 domain-containing protein [Sinimarinibacterium sp. NLF-5-8]